MEDLSNKQEAKSLSPRQVAICISALNHLLAVAGEPATCSHSPFVRTRDLARLKAKLSTHVDSLESKRVATRQTSYPVSFTGAERKTIDLLLAYALAYEIDNWNDNLSFISVTEARDYSEALRATNFEGELILSDAQVELSLGLLSYEFVEDDLCLGMLIQVMSSAQGNPSESLARKLRWTRWGVQKPIALDQEDANPLPIKLSDLDVMILVNCLETACLAFISQSVELVDQLEANSLFGVNAGDFALLAMQIAQDDL